MLEVLTGSSLPKIEVLISDLSKHNTEKFFKKLEFDWDFFVFSQSHTHTFLDTVLIQNPGIKLNEMKWPSSKVRGT